MGTKITKKKPRGQSPPAKKTKKGLTISFALVSRNTENTALGTFRLTHSRLNIGAWSYVVTEVVRLIGRISSCIHLPVMKEIRGPTLAVYSNLAWTLILKHGSLS